MAVAGLLLLAAVEAQVGEMDCDDPGPACRRTIAELQANEDRASATFGMAGGVLIALVLVAWSRLVSRPVPSTSARVGEPGRRA